MKSAPSSSACKSVGTDDHSRHRIDHDIDSGKERILTICGILFTFGAITMALWEIGSTWLLRLSSEDWHGLTTQSLFMIIVGFLIYGGLVYQFTRLAYYTRISRHQPATRHETEYFFEQIDAPSLTILVPSYREEESVIAQTLMSAALQDYPNRRVVLLIDDPPHPQNPEDAASLAAARALPMQIQRLLKEPRSRFADVLADFEARAKTFRANPVRETARLSEQLEAAADWFEQQINQQRTTTHVDELYINLLLKTHRDDLLTRAATLSQESGLKIADIRRQYRRLAALFDVELCSFERKRYINLSHEPNKAMNLNSYIGLTGKFYREYLGAGGLHLEETAPVNADLWVPESDYFITLDADSVLAPDYALRLIHFMEQPDNARVAVAQTPYSAVPNAPGMLERIAGATTDIQYIIHQGFTAYGATFWVGANALLRRIALEEIAVNEEERGFPVTRYIQDRTVIEDTESSVDLVERGWQLYNYPERLAFSATPPDFGSLLIQRRRWANGGLIILPKLLRYLAQGRTEQGEGFMRIHYLISIAAVNIGLLLLLATPFSGSITSLWLPLTAAAYFILYSRDLKLIGYRGSDLFRVYALNLLLIPVNLGGVFKSLQQTWTKEKIPFGRTPKVTGRTGAPALYVAAVYGMLSSWFLFAGIDLSKGQWAHGIFAMVNATFLCYAAVRFVGLRSSWEDLVQNFQLPAMPKARPHRAGEADTLSRCSATQKVLSLPPRGMRQLGWRLMKRASMAKIR